jgi:predicted NAD/FAD-binding protein
MKIAVIGSGISGLGAAYILSREHEVHLFEADSRLGGHAHTVQVQDSGGSISMDTGFLVYNELTYPHLKAFFAHLEVKTVDSNMTLAIQNEKTGLEWAGTNLNTVFGQRRNLLNISFLRTLLNILRFHREVEDNLLLARRHGWTIRELVENRKFADVFCKNYLLPMAAAIWSTPEAGMLEFPAETFLTFLINHKLVQVNDRPIWRTVEGGSIQYVEKVAKHLKHIHLNTPVLQVERIDGKVQVKTAKEIANFDTVVFATHAPVTARILKMTDADEIEILSSFQVEPNTAILHQDAKMMPTQRRCWSAWNVFAADSNSGAKASLTYFLNLLQPLGKVGNYFLTLNPNRKMDSIVREFEYDHPRFDLKAIRAQSRLAEIQGRGGVYFAGAWTRYGFHEDGLLSGVRAAALIGVETPWKIK